MKKLTRHTLTFIIFTMSYCFFIEIPRSIFIRSQFSKPQIEIRDQVFQHSCINKTFKFDELHICGFSKQRQKESGSSLMLVLATTMYNEEGKMFIFNNTINNWASFWPNVQPVLYLSDSSLLVNQRGMVEHACAIGWTVLMVPECNNLTYPLFREMVVYSQMIFPQAKWYGYANGDILFDYSLIETLQFLLDFTASQKKDIDMVVGQHYHTLLPRDNSMATYRHYMKNVEAKDVGDNFAIDYFISKAGNYQWQDIPPFVIGRPRFDNWLLWNLVEEKMNGVDATESILAIHQGEAGKTEEDNTYWFRDRGLYYNQDIIERMNQSEKDIRNRGRTTCMPYALVNLDRSPFMQLNAVPVHSKNFRYITNHIKLQAAARYLYRYNASGLRLEMAMHESNVGEIYLRTAVNTDFTLFYLDGRGIIRSPMIKNLMYKAEIMGILNSKVDILGNKKTRLALFKRYNYTTICTELDDLRLVPASLVYKM